MLIIKGFRMFFKREGFIVLNNNNKDSGKNNSSSSKELSAVSRRPPLPDLPNLRVSVGESPKLAKKIAQLRLNSASISKLFKDVLEDEENGPF